MTLLELLKTIFVPEYDNQYFEKAQAVIEKISIACSNFLKKLEEFPIEGVYEASASKALSKIYYPPCMCLSYEQNIEVVKILGCNDNPSQEDIENIESIIFDVYTDDKIRELLTSWKEIMRPQRWDIVNEAIETYFNGHYYACNALLLSQYTESVLRVPYARKNIILLKSKENNMNFNIIEMPENIYHQFFEGQDWDRFVATEQIFFVDSVAYICCY